MVGKGFRPLLQFLSTIKNEGEVRFSILMDFCRFW